MNSEKTKWRVLVTDVAWPSIEPEAAVLGRVGGELELAETGQEDELLEMVADADAILTCWAQVTGAVIEAGKKVQVIGRFGVGLDNIDVKTATRLGIPVTNVPVYCVDEVAEHSLALLLACARKVCLYNSNVHTANDWEVKSGIPLFRVRGRRLGIVGFGNIGRGLAPRAQALGLEVLVFDPYVDAEAAAKLGCEKVELKELLVRSDFVSIHAPLTDDTRGLIDAEKLALMKPTAYIINVARGAIIDQDALVASLEDGRIAGAALDVFVPERLPPDHPLLKLPNVITTPHVGFYSEDSIRELEIKGAENVAQLLSGQRPAHVVNPEVLELPRWSHLR